MHSISWRQRNRNLERFFYKRTRSYFSFSNSIHSQDVSPARSDPEVHEASHGGDDSQRKGGESPLQQAKLRTRKEDEAKRLLLLAD